MRAARGCAAAASTRGYRRTGVGLLDGGVERTAVGDGGIGASPIDHRAARVVADSSVEPNARVTLERSVEAEATVLVRDAPVELACVWATALDAGEQAAAVGAAGVARARVAVVAATTCLRAQAGAEIAAGDRAGVAIRVGAVGVCHAAPGDKGRRAARCFTMI